MPWWGLFLVVVAACLAVVLAVKTGLIPQTRTASIELYSGRVKYETTVVGVTVRTELHDRGMARSILEYYGSYPEQEEWAIAYQYGKGLGNTFSLITPLRHAQFELLNIHLNVFDGGLGTFDETYIRTYSAEVKAVIAERTLEVLRNSRDYGSAASYQSYVTYQTQGMDLVDDVGMIPTIEEFQVAEFDDSKLYVQ